MRDLYIVRWLRLTFWRLFRKILIQRASPHAIALGTAIGVFISVTPTVGVQMLLGVIIATIVGANRVAAAVPAWITNPVTIVPVYTFNYWLGTLFVGGIDAEEFRHEFGKITVFLHDGAVADAWRALLSLGLEVLIPLWLGCVLVGLILALPTYPLMLRSVAWFHAHRHRKRTERHKRVLDRLREKLHSTGTKTEES